MKKLIGFLLVVLAFAGCKQSDEITNSSGGGPPTITSVSPSTVLRGQTIDGQIRGTNFNGVGLVNMGDGIRVIQITAVSSTEINLRYFVNTNASPGTRTISITTASGTATNATALSVGSNRAPNAHFSVDPTIGVSQTVFSFDASGSSDQDGTISGYSWDFGDGQTAGGKKVTHKFTSPGKFNVKLTVSDNDQGQTLASRDLEVKMESFR